MAVSMTPLLECALAWETIRVIVGIACMLTDTDIYMFFYIYVMLFFSGVACIFVRTICFDVCSSRYLLFIYISKCIFCFVAKVFPPIFKWDTFQYGSPNARAHMLCEIIPV